MRGEQDAHDQRAQVTLDPTAVNSAYPGTSAITMPNSDCISPWPNRPQILRSSRDSGQSNTRIPAHGLQMATGRGEEDHRDDVLDDQDADRDPAVERAPPGVPPAP